jgi:DNA invertase Pin-like site-specific DNA recombinase
MPADRGKVFSYLRVSTDRQGQRGYGLEAQHKAIADYLTGGSWELLGEFVEIESGKRNDRPQLEAALAACKRHKAKLVIAKLDRLSRNLAFIATLMERRVDFVCCDMPEANRLTIHIIAAMAEHERSMISERTKAALAAAKARGVRLGSKKLAEARKLAAVAIKAGADRYAANVLPIIREIQRAGATTREDIANALNARGIATARGGRWYGSSVRNILARAVTGLARQGHPGVTTSRRSSLSNPVSALSTRETVLAR